MDGAMEAAAPIVSPAYIEFQREVVINSDIWSTTARILSADFGFEGIIGIPGLGGASTLGLAVAAGAGVNADFATLTPQPPLRALTAATPVASLIQGGYGAQVIHGDALPIVFSLPVLPGTLAPTDIAIRLNTGEVVTPQAVGLNPNLEYNERNVVVVFGEFGNRLTPGTEGAIHPVSVEIVSDDKPLMLVGPDGLQSAVGMTAASGNPYVTGPSLLAAKLSRFSAVGDSGPVSLMGGVTNDGATLYQGAATYRLRLLTNGGFSPDGVSAIRPGDFSRFFQLQAVDSEGRLVTITQDGVAYDLGPGLGIVKVVGLADLGVPPAGIPAPYYLADNDNYIDIILTGDDAAVRSLLNVKIPTAAEAGYSDIYTPGGPGRTPVTGTIYTRPAATQTLAITDSLDRLTTVSYAAQQVAAYDRHDNLPVIFRLHHAGTGDTVLTASSNRAASLLAQGYGEQGVPFANDGNSQATLAVREFYSAAAGDHVYTADAVEIERLLLPGSGYQDQGVVFRAMGHAAPGAAPIHRFFSANTGNHLYSPSLTEGFTSDGYAYEGVAWYAADLLPGPKGVVTFDRSDALDFTGSLTGNDTLLKQGVGILTLSGESRLTGGTQVAAGTLEVNGSLETTSLTIVTGSALSGSGTVTGSVLNAGTLSPGRSPGVLTIRGDVVSVATADLRVEIDGPVAGAGEGRHDRLVVSGGFAADGIVTAVLRGFAEADATSFTPALGQGFTILQAAGGITGGFTGLNQPAGGLPAGARLDLSYGSTDVALLVTPSSYAGIGGLDEGQRSVGASLDSLRPAAGTRQMNDRGVLFEALYRTAPAAIPAALTTMGGALHPDMVRGGLDAARMFSDILSDRQALLRRGAVSGTGQALPEIDGTDNDVRLSDSAAANAANLWARINLGSRNGSGLDRDQVGLTTGFDVPAPGNSRLGAAIGYVRTDLDGAGGDSTMNSYMLAAYGGITHGRLFGTADIAFGMSDHDARRPIRFGSIDRLALSDGKGSQFGAGFTAGYRATVAGLLFEAAGGLRYDQVSGEGFREAGAGALDLSVDNLDLHALRSEAGLRLAARYRSTADLIVEPELHVRWDHDFRDVAARSLFRLDGAGFHQAGAARGRDAAVIGAGLTARKDGWLEAFAQIDLDRREGEVGRTASLGIRLRFG
ncbi:autotransporter outer membrane beta-barrel domain-containing protein [Niveispirillum fermenti]|uniref:autotransporter outer membrane beta-barrel domain-containing protein n=1 Tax=Niveispirillum fermenti TaxID=1233113 RepID=UPI003A8C6201